MMNRGRPFLIVSVFFLSCIGIGIGVKDIFFYGDYRSIILNVWILLGIAAYWWLYLFGGKESAKTRAPRGYAYVEKQNEEIERLEKRRAELEGKCLELEEERAELEIRLAEIEKELMEEELKLAAMESPLKKPTSGKLH
jgi:hypothetical protein